MMNRDKMTTKQNYYIYRNFAVTVKLLSKKNIWKMEVIKGTVVETKQ